MRNVSLASLSLVASLTFGVRPAHADPRHPSFIEDSERFLFRVLEDDQGGFYAVWTHRLGDESFNLIGQHVGGDGKPLWKRPGTVLASRVTSPDDWDAFPDGKNGMTLTWIEHNRTRAQRFDGAGNGLWPEKAAVTSSTMSAISPTGVADAGGGAYLIWSEQRYVNRRVLVSQRLNAVGAPVWPVEGTRVSLRPSDQRHPRVVFDGQGGAVIAWNDLRESSSQLMAQRMDFQATRTWGAEGVLVTAPAANPKEAPMMAPLGDGGAAFVWSGPSSGANRMFLQALDAQGRFRWGPQGAGLAAGTWDQWNPSLIGDGRGLLWAGWEDYRNHSHWQAFMANFDRDMHTAWPGSEAPVAPVIADQGRLRFVEDGRKGVFAAWVDNRAGRTGLYVQEIDAQGRAMLGEEGMTISVGLENPAPPQLANLAPGRAAIFYADRERKDRWALYWKAVAGPSPQSPPRVFNSPKKSIPNPRRAPEDEVPLPSGVGEGR